MEDMCNNIARIYKPYARPYEESKMGFEVFGLDIMIDDNYKVYLIEINDRVGYAPSQGKRDKPYLDYCRKYLKLIYEDAIKNLIE